MMEVICFECHENMANAGGHGTDDYTSFTYECPKCKKKITVKEEHDERERLCLHKIHKLEAEKYRIRCPRTSDGACDKTCNPKDCHALTLTIFLQTLGWPKGSLGVGAISATWPPSRSSTPSHLFAFQTRHRR